MRGMFFRAKAFGGPKAIADPEASDVGISGWNTQNVQDMGVMFRETDHFNQDISGWETGSVTDMERIFNNAKAFNQNISGWDVRKVTNFTDWGTGSNPDWTEDKKPVFEELSPDLLQF